jgi:hypothetical protein
MNYFIPTVSVDRVGVQPPPEQGDYKIPIQHGKYELF